MSNKPHITPSEAVAYINEIAAVAQDENDGLEPGSGLVCINVQTARAIAALIERLGDKGECEWLHDPDDDAWDSDCGERWCFIDDGPKENRVTYCHGCGRKVRALLNQPDPGGVSKPNTVGEA